MKIKNSKVIIFILLLLVTITGCSNNINNNSSKPDNTIDGIINLVEIRNVKFYLTNKVESLGNQFTNSTELRMCGGKCYDANNLNDFYTSKTDDWAFFNAYLLADKGNTKILEFDIRGEDINTLIKDYTIENYNILEGIFYINNKKFEIGKSNTNDIIAELGNNYEYNKTLNLYTYKFDDYKWDTYHFYMKNDIISNVAIYNYN